MAPNPVLWGTRHDTLAEGGGGSGFVLQAHLSTGLVVFTLMVDLFGGTERNPLVEPLSGLLKHRPESQGWERGHPLSSGFPFCWDPAEWAGQPHLVSVLRSLLLRPETILVHS